MQNGHSVIIRDMQKGEEKALLCMARQAFIHSPLEQLVISKPKIALVAEVDGAIAGAVFLHIFDSGKKTGYLDIGFVNKEYRGLGIAHVLYPAAIAFFREKGCDLVAAQIRDDNAASWKPIRSQGFATSTFTDLVKSLGLGRAILLWLQTHSLIACGSQLWISAPAKERSSKKELISFLCVNLLLYLPWLLQLIHQPSRLLDTLLAYPFVLLSGVLFGRLGCFAAGDSWHFLFPRSGMFITLLLNTLGGLFPMVGRWYLKDPQPTHECRRSMGVQATIEWVGMLALFTLGAFLLKGDTFFYRCAALTTNLLFYRILPFMPFGGGRVWNWNKLVFSVLTMVTFVLIFIL